jgi:uncharacterized protein (TIGR02266 family)
VDKKDNPGEDRRLHHRADMILKVDYQNIEEFIADFSENVSQGGLFIATDQAFTRGTELDFEVSFPGLLDPLLMKGVVKWCRSTPNEEGAAGIGVQFLPEQSPGRSTLRNILSDSPPREDGGSPSTPVPEFRVLLVEDNPVVRDMFHFGIEKFSKREAFANVRFDIQEACDGKVALDLLRQSTFHLLVMDLYMPVMDGSTLIQNIRADPNLKDIPILVVSSGGKEGRADAIKAGADVYLDKPVKLKEITETIATLVAVGHLPKKRNPR